MNLRKSINVVTLIVVVGLLAPGFSVGAADLAPPEAGTQFVRVPAMAMSDLNRLGLSPRSSLDYGAFYWLELDKGDLGRLSTSAVPFTPIPDAGKVQVTRFRFDPVVEGEPGLPANLRAGGEGPGFRLIQLAGPARDAWLAQLEAAGLPLLQYYPHNSYLTWTTTAAAESVEALDFVRWQGAVHPGYKINGDLLKRSGLIRNVDVEFYNDGDVQATVGAIAQLGGNVLQYYPAQPDRAFFDAIVELDARAIEDIARMDTVLWLGYASPEPILDDEMSSQIVAGNYSGGVPFTGYFDWLNDLGYDGAGVRWAIVDTGVDYDHPDLGPHIAGGYSFPGACDPPGQPGSDCAGGGHGTHVAGIVGGDATAGFTDPNGFLYGLGIAPAYEIFAMNSLSGPYWPPTGGWQEHSKQAVLGQAIGGNNSWTTGEGTAHGYQSSERTHDFMVRDGNFDTGDVAEPFIEVFSAGNSGSAGLTAPKEAKNLIVTASSRNYRVGSIDSISGFSSWGPAVDGRWVPTVAAPGEEIASARNDLGGSCSTAIPGTNNMYAYCSGTSMAAPHVAGSITLITEWWRTFNGGADPSPAMAKALLVNGAVDMNEGNPIPNIHEGWGRVHLTNVMDSGAEVIYYDQTHLFDNTGESWEITVGVPDPTKPFKVSLAWSDAPGAVGANPALVNDLDLMVDHGGDAYLGNNFSNGWSVPGGNADVLNNMENVYIQNPGSSATITVLASNLPGDGVPIFGDATDQDFALVCYNCVLQPDFSLAAEPASQDVCAPADAEYDITVENILGFDDAVVLSAEGEPAGTTVQFSVNPIVPPGVTVLTIGDTAFATPGSYAIDVVGVAPTSTHTTTVGLNLYDVVPGAVTLVSPGDGEIDVPPMPAFEWTAATQGAAYDLQVATDPGFVTVVYSATVQGTSHTATSNLDPDTNHYWRVRAQNACGAGSYSSTFTFRTRAIPPILLVDDDDNSPDVRSYYTDALDALDLEYDVWDTDNSDVEPGAATLSAYSAVIWFTGDEYGGAAGPGADGEAALASFLDGGKCLFISSQDYHYDRGLTAFMQDYLGVASASNDNGNYTSVTGYGSVFGGMGPYSLSYPFTDYSDVVSPDVTAELAFDGNNGNDAAVNKDSGVYRTTFWGYPFEAVAGADDRIDLMDTIMAWCNPVIAAIELDKTVGTDAGECAASDSIAVLAGTDVTYCYEVVNTGSITFTLHDLTDSALGPIFVDEPYALSPGDSLFITQTANITQTTVNIATWTAHVPGGPSASDTNTATVTILEPSLTLTKTVGTDAGACAATDAMTVPAGVDVTYCYEVVNTGDITFTLHDLADSALGPIFVDEPYTLVPGDSFFVTQTANITQTTVNTATWTAHVPGGPSASDTDTATVTALQPSLTLTKTVGTDANTCASTGAITVPVGTDVTYCYEVVNTGEVTFTLHNLADSALGSILVGEPYTLSPGDTFLITQTANITQTTVNTATWTAYPVDGLPAEASDTATVELEPEPLFFIYLPIVVKDASS